jgi:large subunit ribosomal protein L4
VHVVSGLVSGDAPSTKSARTVLDALAGRNSKLLVVISRADEVGRRSVRNLRSVHVLTPDQLNTYDVLSNDDVVFTVDALQAFLAGPSSYKVSRATAVQEAAR